jgi:hypothetical protein
MANSHYHQTLVEHEAQREQQVPSTSCHFDTTFSPTMENECVKKRTTSTFNQSPFDTTTFVPTTKNKHTKWWKSKMHLFKILMRLLLQDRKDNK